jgi:hypothetical protein
MLQRGGRARRLVPPPAWWASHVRAWRGGGVGAWWWRRERSSLAGRSRKGGSLPSGGRQIRGDAGANCCSCCATGCSSSAGSGCVSPCLVLSVVRKHTFCRCRCIAGDSQHQEMQTITSNLACACIWTEAPNMSPPQLWWDTTRDDWNAKESIISQLRSGTCHNTKQDKSESFFY